MQSGMSRRCVSTSKAAVCYNSAHPALHRGLPNSSCVPPHSTAYEQETRKIILSMERVTKTAPNGKQILNDVGVAMYLGAKIAVLGSNGAGKSTLMRMLAGKDDQFEGTYNKVRKVSGSPYHQLPPSGSAASHVVEVGSRQQAMGTYSSPGEQIQDLHTGTAFDCPVLWRPGTWHQGVAPGAGAAIE